MHYKSELMSVSCWGGLWLVAVLVSTFVRILRGGGFHTLLNLLLLHSSSVLVWTHVRHRFRRYAGLSDWRRVRGGFLSLCSASTFLPSCRGGRYRVIFAEHNTEYST
jgi:hypothetical protein